MIIAQSKKYGATTGKMPDVTPQKNNAVGLIVIDDRLAFHKIAQAGFIDQVREQPQRALFIDAQGMHDLEDITRMD